MSQKLIDEKIKNFRNYLEQGNQHKRQGKLEEAILCYQKAKELNPKSFWPYHLLGCTLEQQGKLDEAVSAWHQAIEQSPTNPNFCWSYYHLALNLEKKQAEEAISYCQNAILINPDETSFYQLLSRLYKSQDKLEEAVYYQDLASKKKSLNRSQLEKKNSRNAETLYITIDNQAHPNSILLELADLPIEELNPKQLPIPPKEVMEYGEAASTHLNLGEITVKKMREIVAQTGYQLENAKRILEFGCANGRLLRWFVDLSENTELWGTDIQSDKIFWAIENLTPPCNFAVNTTVPHLSFPDRHFDFIFAGSIFTHINELHLSWLLELARLLTPTGLLYITVHDEHTVEYFTNNPDNSLRKRLETDSLYSNIINNQFDFASISPYLRDGMLSQVFMSSKYIQRITQKYLNLVGVYPNAYSNLQTAYLFSLK